MGRSEKIDHTFELPTQGLNENDVRFQVRPLAGEGLEICDTSDDLYIPFPKQTLQSCPSKR
jgi:hypothetical protein